MIAIASANIQMVNDILGVTKDFGYGDGEVVFRVLYKGETLEGAVNSMCDKINQDLQDLILVKVTLLDIFGDEENLVRFLNLIDGIIDGQNFVYMENLRYKCRRGCVRLSREGN